MLMVITGYGMMQEMAASNTILQTVVPEDKRGRAMSFYSMAFAGTAPFGSLGAGYVAQRIGAPTTLMIGGIACVLGAVWFTSQLKRIRELVRPIYVSLGILPEVATGIQAASSVIQETER
jgi:predicted MFS family arabinose efflux permease